METPKQRIKTETMPGEMSSPISSISDKQGVIITPDSSKKSPQNLSQQVREPHDNDVLCGRGGSINSHLGNGRFRQLVEKRKRVYLAARFKREKRLIANSILSEIKALKPSGRFLAKDTKTGNWHDIGDERARDKTSQALRENAPSIRAEIEVEINQQRAETQRAEEEEASFAAACATGPPHPYYQQPWGYYAPYPRYGQYQAETSPYGQDESYECQWHRQYSEGEEQSLNRSHSALGSRREIPRGHHYPERHGDHAHSMRERRREIHVPSSIAPWTRTSFSDVHSRVSDHDETSRSRTPPPGKPVPYVHQCRSLDQIDPRGCRQMVHFEEDGRSRNHQHPSHYHYGHRRSHSGSDYYTSPSHPFGFRHDDEKDESYRQGVLKNAVIPESATRKPACRQDDEVIKPHPARRRDDKVILSHPMRRRNDEAILPYPARRQDDEARLSHPACRRDDEARLSLPARRREEETRLSHPAHRREEETRLSHPASPATYPDGGQSSTLLSQVENHIMGSWDTNMACANSSIEASLMSSTDSKHVRQSYKDQHPSRFSLADAMEDEEQGQEVELVEMEDYQRGPEKSYIDEEYDDIRDEGHRMPPPDATGMPPPSRRIEIDWSSRMVGCQSNWLPESFNPPSFFVQKNNPLSPSASYEMDESAAGTEGGSVGGTSLCQVFAQDQIADGSTVPISSAPGVNQELTQIPSWERGVRSKSPSTIYSDSSVQDTIAATSKGSSTGDKPPHIMAPLTSPAKNYEMKE